MDKTEYQPSQIEQQRLEQLVQEGRHAEVVTMSQPYGNLTELNTSRRILDAVGAEALEDIAAGYLMLLQTSSAIFEKNGDYALDITSSGWCRFLKNSSRHLCGTNDHRVALTCGKWHCHVASWYEASLRAIQTGQAVDIESPSGLRLYALPIYAGTEIIGSINFSYGEPPKNLQRLAEIAELYGVSIAELQQYANSYQPQPDLIIEAAKKQLQTSAKLIGEIVQRQQIEQERQQTAERLAASEQQVTEQLTDLNHLHNLSVRLSHTLDIQTVLQEVLNAVTALQKADMGAIMLYEAQQDNLYPVASIGFTAEDLKLIECVPNGMGACSLAIAAPHPVIIEDVEEDPQFAPLVKMAWLKGCRAVGCVPLMSHSGEIIGLLATYFTQLHHPSNRELNLVDLYAQQASKAIENARLYSKLQEVQRRKDESLALVDAFFESAPIGLAFHDCNLRWVRLNKYIANINGVAVENHLGRTVYDILPPKLAAKIDLVFRRVLETKQAVLNVELRGETYADPNHPRYWLANYYPVKSKDDEILGIGVAILEITDLKSAEEALRRSEERLRLSLNAGSMGIWDWNIATGELKWSDNLEEIHHMAPGSFDGTFAGFQKIIHPDDREYVNQAIIRVVEEGADYDIEFRVIASNGSIQWMTGKGQTFCDETGKAVRMIGVGTNITARKQVEAALLSKSEELEQANRLKDEFLAVLSHELRSPLNAILGWATLLRTRDFDRVATNRALETIERNAKLQTQLIEDLLDISRIIQGKLNIVPSVVNLVTVIDNSIDTTRLAAEAKSINLTFVIENNLSPDNSIGLYVSSISDRVRSLTPNTRHPFFVMGDASRLQQVVWNLLSNAIKFTPNGGQVEVRLSVIEGTGNREQGTGNGDKGDIFYQSTVTSQQSTIPIQNPKSKIQNSTPVTQYAQIQVKDTGKGISTEFLPYVFDRFRQADGSTTRSQTGLGLGLAIARHLVELHGGTISAQSAGVELGATFTVMLPLLKTEAPKPKVEAKSVENLPSAPATLHSILENLHILVVDDDADVRFFLSTLLRQYGASVTEMPSATEALTILEGFQPDILVSDIGMPDIDGYKFIRQVRANSTNRSRHIPAIALTAYVRAEDRRVAIEAGFQMHISKPIEPDQLIAAIAQLTQRS